jgi:hypothetical protein
VDGEHVVHLGPIGPLPDVSLQVWDIPFDFQPTELRFFPAPWSVPLRNPFRPGLVADVGEPSAPRRVCFSSSRASTGREHPPEWRGAARLPRERRDGDVRLARSPAEPHPARLYGRRDPTDVNQFGAELRAMSRPGGELTLNYARQRALVDLGAALAKVHIGAVNSDPFALIHLSPQETTDPITRRTTPVAGYVRVPSSSTIRTSGDFPDDNVDVLDMEGLRIEPSVKAALDARGHRIGEG